MISWWLSRCWVTDECGGDDDDDNDNGGGDDDDDNDHDHDDDDDDDDDDDSNRYSMIDVYMFGWIDRWWMSWLLLLFGVEAIYMCYGEDKCMDSYLDG